MLSPALLARALYPKLTSYISYDKEEHAQLYLQRKAVHGDHATGEHQALTISIITIYGQRS